MGPSVVASTMDPAAVFDTSYQIIKRRESDPREVEEAGTSIIEVTVLWGQSIVQVAHLEPSQSFTFTTGVARPLPTLPALFGGFAAGGSMLATSAVTGAWTLGVAGAAIALSGAGASLAVDRRNAASRHDGTRFIVDPEVLGGASELPVIELRAGIPMFVFAAGADGEIDIEGTSCSLHDVAAGSASGSRLEVPLATGGRYRISIGAFTVSIAIVARGRRTTRGRRIDRASIWASVSALVAMSMLIGPAWVTSTRTPSLIADEDYESRLHDLQRIMAFASEHQPMERPVEDPRAHDESSAIGRSHHEAAGSMGRLDDAQRDRRYALARTDAVPHLARQNARDVVAQRGIFAALAQPGSVMNAEGPISPFGSMTASGGDAVTFAGNMTADLAGNAFGYDGLGRGGIGFGGGGSGEGTIGTSPFGMMGGGRGECGCGEGGRNLGLIGTLHGRMVGQPSATPSVPPRGVTLGPVLRCGTPGCEASSEGSLSADAIRRVVLRNLGQVQYCHEQGLREDATLAGRVAVRFVIGSDGNVLGTSLTENAVAIPGVGACIASAIRRWTFPSPEGGGVVTVTYPFVLHAPE